MLVTFDNNYFAYNMHWQLTKGNAYSLKNKVFKNICECNYIIINHYIYRLQIGSK